MSGADNATALAQPQPSGQKKKKNKKRKGKGKGARRTSFTLPPADSAAAEALASSQEPGSKQKDRPFYKLGHAMGGNLSDTSIDSQALLDHRYDPGDRCRLGSGADTQLGISCQCGRAVIVGLLSHLLISARRSELLTLPAIQVALHIDDSVPGRLAAIGVTTKSPAMRAHLC